MADKPKSADIYPGPGFRIRSAFARPAPEILEQFQRFEAPDISDQMNRMYTMSSAIGCLAGEASFVGPALTVKVYPGDNLMVHKALDLGRPGDVMVIDAGGSAMNGVLGDLISTKARHRGFRAFVVDGLIRDLPGVVDSGMTVFARGVTPLGPLHRGPGEINYPVSCGGIVVLPGDIIVGDRNGVTVVRRDFAEEILRRLWQNQEAQAAYVADVKRGVFSNSWVDKLLADSGCVIE